jgi:hypothetical protein
VLLEGEVGGSFVDVGQDRLVLLGEERHEIHLAVVVQVGGNDVNSAGARVDRVVRERRLGRVCRPVLQDRDVPGLAPSEGRDREVVLAVSVEIRGFDVRHPGPAVEPRRAELAAAEPAQPDHGPFVVIGGEELAQIADEEVLDAVAVDVGDRDV